MHSAQHLSPWRLHQDVLLWGVSLFRVVIIGLSTCMTIAAE